MFMKSSFDIMYICSIFAVFALTCFAHWNYNLDVRVHWDKSPVNEFNNLMNQTHKEV